MSMTMNEKAIVNKMISDTEKMQLILDNISSKKALIREIQKNELLTSMLGRTISRNEMFSEFMKDLVSIKKEKKEVKQNDR
jgi:hypothetical protein